MLIITSEGLVVPWTGEPELIAEQLAPDLNEQLSAFGYELG